MKDLFFTQAVAEALSEEMERDPSVFMLGEDIGAYGGAFGVSRGLMERFGPSRIVDSPISENSIVGLGIGAALTGLRPVIEIMYMDFITLAFDQLLNKAAKIRFLSQGRRGVPLVVRTAAGGGRFYGPDHSQSLEALFLHVPGLVIAAPSNPGDAKGMLKAAIRSDDPVLFVEHKMLYATRGPVPEGPDGIVPLGQAAVVRSGTDLTIAAFGRMIGLAQQAAERAAAEDGVQAEIVDLRTVSPLDWKTLAASVEKTRRLLTVEEGCRTGGVGGEIAALAAEKLFYSLDAPIARVAARDVPIPFSPHLEGSVLPSVESIQTAIVECMRA